MSDYYTEDLSRFGHRERQMAAELLAAFGTDRDDTEHFDNAGVRVAFNLNSGYVFLVNEEYDVAVMVGGRLVDFLTCPECGHEGARGEDWTDDRHWVDDDGPVYCSDETWMAGWNMPGYMPEVEVERFRDGESALDYVTAELERVWQGLEPGDPAEFSFPVKRTELWENGSTDIPNTGGDHDLGVNYWVEQV